MPAGSLFSYCENPWPVPANPPTPPEPPVPEHPGQPEPEPIPDS